MTTFASYRNRPKAHIVGVGRRGGPLTWVIPGRKKFVEVHWWVLGKFLQKLFWGVVVFGCGILTGILWVIGD